MIEMKGLVPLNLVKHEMDASIQVAESHLKQVMEEPDDLSQLKDFAGLMRQVLGVAKMIDLNGVVMLIENVLVLVRQVEDKNSRFADQDAALGGLGHALLVLTHYLDYVHRSQRVLSVLLLTPINEVRRLTGNALINEWAFVGHGIQYQPLTNFKGKNAQNQLEFHEIPAKCARLRQMYQVGLLSVLKDEGQKNNLQMMVRSVERWSSYCGRLPVSQVWWIAQGVLEAFAAGDVALDNGRKVLLRKFDSIMKRILEDPQTELERSIEPELLQECLHIIALSHDVSPLIEDIKSAFSIKPATQSFLDTHLRLERERMNGPGGSIIAQVAMGLKEEILKVKDTIEMGARGMVIEQGSLQEVQDVMTRISSTLVMLSLPEANKQLEVVQNTVSQWQDSSSKADDESFDLVADAILSVESELAKLAREFEKEVVPSYAEPSQEDQVLPANLLEESRLLVVGESRIGLSMSKKAIASYVESDYRIEHIENVPVTLKTVSGALGFLELNRAAVIVKDCLHFVEQRMLDSTQGGIPHDTFETMADAMSSVDYYLESMEDRRPIGDGLLDLAEQSIAELGLTKK